jgi:YggT family protein
VSVVIGVLYEAVWLYSLVLIARMVISLIASFARQWEPKGVVVIALEFVFMITDPPLRALRRIIPPLRIGQVAFDLAFLILFLGIQLLLGFLQSV